MGGEGCMWGEYVDATNIIPMLVRGCGCCCALLRGGRRSEPRPKTPTPSARNWRGTVAPRPLVECDRKLGRWREFATVDKSRPSKVKLSVFFGGRLVFLGGRIEESPRWWRKTCSQLGSHSTRGLAATGGHIPDGLALGGVLCFCRLMGYGSGRPPDDDDDVLCSKFLRSVPLDTLRGR
jgi:hypothetical protein